MILSEMLIFSNISTLSFFVSCTQVLFKAFRRDIGYFEQTLPEMKNEVGMIALLHMDWYESTKAVLQNLYDHISANGIIQVDDYGLVVKRGVPPSH